MATEAATHPTMERVSESEVDATHVYSIPKPDVFQVRGPSYLSDHTKVTPAAPVFELVRIDAFRVIGKQDHIVSDPRSFYAQQEATSPGTHEYLVIVYQTPEPFGADPKGSRFHLVSYFRRPVVKEGDESVSPKFEALWKRFREGTDEERKARWKVLPHLADGPWAVSMAMGSRPALLASKLEHTFFVGPNYLEVDCDVGASLSYLPAISTLIGLLQQYATRLVIDVGFVVEAQDDDELPEMLLAAARLHHMEPYTPPVVDAATAEASTAEDKK